MGEHLIHDVIRVNGHFRQRDLYLRFGFAQLNSVIVLVIQLLRGKIFYMSENIRAINDHFIIFVIYRRHELGLQLIVPLLIEEVHLLVREVFPGDGVLVHCALKAY